MSPVQRDGADREGVLGDRECARKGHPELELSCRAGAGTTALTFQVRRGSASRDRERSPQRSAGDTTSSCERGSAAPLTSSECIELPGAALLEVKC